METEMTETPINVCPYCGYTTNCATGLDGHIPKELDISVCIKCFSIALFNKDLSLRKPEPEEFADIRNDFDTWRGIERFRFALRESYKMDLGKK
jgi:hypothetical protein